MHAAATAQPVEQTQVVEPSPRLWTQKEFHHLGELGLFHGQRAELVEGAIMVLSPQKFIHFSTADRVAEVLRISFGPEVWVRIQGPVDFGPFSEPEPDISAVAGRREDYADHPTSALLIVEVSDTTLAYDRGRKASLYARTGIADYWIVNLVAGQLEVYRDPVADSAQPHGFRYATQTVKGKGDTVTPLALPQASLAVAALLP